MHHYGKDCKNKKKQTNEKEKNNNNNNCEKCWN